MLQRSPTFPLVTAFLVTLAGTAHAQKYERVLGGPNSYEQAFDVSLYRNAGGYVTAGEFISGADNFIQVVRFDRLGNRLWNHVYASDLLTTGFSIEQANNGDILVAGTIDFGLGGGLSTVVMRLDPAGNVIWSNAYAGTVGTDPIHTPEPGPALVEDEAGRIYVVTNFQGAPSAFGLRADGSVLWSWIYFDPSAGIGSERLHHFAFTDIKAESDGTLVISGTSRVTDPNLGLPFTDMQDPMLLRIDAAGMPIVAAHYNYSGTLDRDTPETGDGLDVNRDTMEIVVAGRSSRPLDPAAPLIQHWLLARTDFAPLGAAYFAVAGANADCTTGYSSVRYNFDQREFAVVGAFAPPGGEATIHGFDRFGTPLWRRHSADQAQLDGIVPAPSCGYLAAGRIGGFMTGGGLDDIFHIKTDDAGETGCSRLVDEAFDPQEPRALFFPVKVGDAPFSEPFPADPFEPFDLEPSLCFNPLCGPCIPDWNGDGVLDFFDILAFLSDFSSGNPSADINGDGALDFFDILQFLSLFSAGCP